MEERVTVSVKDFPSKKFWLEFQAACLVNRIKTGDALKEAIELWFKHNKSNK